jgi:hypothetical protein
VSRQLSSLTMLTNVSSCCCRMTNEALINSSYAGIHGSDYRLDKTALYGPSNFANCQ